MMTKILAGRSGLSNRSGICGALVEYLEKEQAGLWFDAQREDLAGHEVVAHVDGNKRNLGRADAKHYQVILVLSQAELTHVRFGSGEVESLYPVGNGMVRGQFWPGCWQSEFSVVCQTGTQPLL